MHPMNQMLASIRSISTAERRANLALGVAMVACLIAMLAR